MNQSHSNWTWNADKIVASWTCQLASMWGEMVWLQLQKLIDSFYFRSRCLCVFVENAFNWRVHSFTLIWQSHTVKDQINYCFVLFILMLSFSLPLTEFLPFAISIDQSILVLLRMSFRMIVSTLCRKKNTSFHISRKKAENNVQYSLKLQRHHKWFFIIVGSG